MGSQGATASGLSVLVATTEKKLNNWKNNFLVLNRRKKQEGKETACLN